MIEPVPRLARTADIDVIVEILVLAFERDPIWGVALARPDGRTDHLDPYWRLFVEGAMRFDTVRVTDDLGACAIWLPPNEDELDEDGLARLEALLDDVMGSAALEALHALYERFEASRAARAPHAYLSLLATHPDRRGQGIGQALLAQLWEPGSARMTFSSLHAHAVPVYTRAGLDAWWPLLYLGGNVRVLRRPDGWTVTTPSPALVAALEAEWTGIDRAADHRAWAARPGGQPVIARRGAQPLAAGTVAGADEEYGIVHLALSPAAGHGEAVDAVRAVLASLNPPDGRARVCLPAPHPATRPLLAAGWHVDFMDLFMATSPELLDPRRAVPSSALA